MDFYAVMRWFEYKFENLCPVLGDKNKLIVLIMKIYLKHFLLNSFLAL